MRYFHTPALRGTRSAQAVRSFRTKSLPSADGRRFAVPTAVGKRVDTCGFYPLNSRFPLFLSLAQTRDRRPLRNRGTAVGLPQRVFLRLFAVHRQITATHTGYFPQARHTRAAQLVSLEFADSTYGLGVRCNLSSQVPCVTTCQGFARHCYAAPCVE